MITNQDNSIRSCVLALSENVCEQKTICMLIHPLTENKNPLEQKTYIQQFPAVCGACMRAGYHPINIFYHATHTNWLLSLLPFLIRQSQKQSDL